MSTICNIFETEWIEFYYTRHRIENYETTLSENYNTTFIV